MSDTPFWFDRALAAPSEPGDVMVDGVSIHYETWGEPGKPGLALVHGSNAHLEWWRFVAPFLADQFRVHPFIDIRNIEADDPFVPDNRPEFLAQQVCYDEAKILHEF